MSEVFLGDPPVTVKQWIKDHYGPKLDELLCFTAEEANSTLHLDKVGSPNAISLETSMDGNTWTDYSWTNKTGDTLTLANIGDKVYMRAKNENQTIGSTSSNYYQFKMTGKIAASGNIQTLLKADGSRTDAPAYCYYYMFEGCSSLTSAPELPATTLANNCYDNMFYGCSSLTQAPVLAATTLANGCYESMFGGCTSLIQAPTLPATTLASGCYSHMFNGCTALTQAPELPATTLASYCYSSMFGNCTALTQAPELPATTLASNCYSSMFEGCSSLTQAPALLATTLASYCYSSMFSECANLTQAPALPATTLAEYCYTDMFSGCSNLNTIKLGYTGKFTDAPSGAFNNWVSGVASTGTFYYNGSDTTTGVNAIPTGWTVIQIQRPELCFTAEEANSTVGMEVVGDAAPKVSLEYSTDGNTWSPF